MTNRLRTPGEDEEVDTKIIVEEKPHKEIPDNYLSQFLANIFNAEKATSALPFVLFIAFLCMIYIGNRHLAENNIRDIDKLTRQVKELNSEYKTTKAELAYKSTLTEVARRLDTLGVQLKEATQPPQKIMTEEVKDER